MPVTNPWKDVPRAKAYEEALSRVLSRLWTHLPGPIHERLFARVRGTRWAVTGPGSDSGRLVISWRRDRPESATIFVNVGFLDPPNGALEGILLHELAHLATQDEDGTPDLEITLSLFGGYLCQRPKRKPRLFALKPANPHDPFRMLQEETKRPRRSRA